MSWLKSSSTPNGANGGRKAGYPLEDLKADIADKISGAIMMVDRDFNVTYVNGPTMELLRKNATAFRGLWPNFDPDKIVGTCIDTFHQESGPPAQASFRSIEAAAEDRNHHRRSEGSASGQRQPGSQGKLRRQRSRVARRHRDPDERGNAFGH